MRENSEMYIVSSAKSIKRKLVKRRGDDEYEKDFYW